MAIKVEFPIRAKLLLLLSGVVLCATGAYLGLATHLFKDDKKQLVYELNASNVKTLSAQTDAMLSRVADKAKLLAQGHGDEAWGRAVFESDPDLIAYTLYKPAPESDRWEPVASIRSGDFLKLYGLNPAEIDKIREKVPVPFTKILAKRTWLMNSTLPGGAPVMSFALALEFRGPGSADKITAGDYVAVIDLRADKLLKTLTGQAIAQAYLVDGDGTLIAHPDPKLVEERAPFVSVPIVAQALQSPVALGVRAFEWSGKRWIGAYSNVPLGNVAVVSQVEESQAFLAARKLIEKSLLFALIVITVSLLLAGMLARSFTVPLEKLLAATEKLSRWEFGDSVHVRTRDEIGKLARSFNAMASDLQSQRAQLEAGRAELELKVRERTAALESQKKQLSEAQDSLIRTTRLASLGELAGSAAHEVLNPLNNINIRIERLRGQLKETEEADAKLLGEILEGWGKAYSEGGWARLEEDLRRVPEGTAKPLLEEDLENLSSISSDLNQRLQGREEDLDFLSKEVTRINRIINNMRSLSRVGGERRPLDVHLPIDDTAVTLGDLFEKRNVALVKDYGAESRENYSIVADRDELVQVFSNLIRNSLHAVSQAQRRAGSIRISTRATPERVEVRVTDNGTGISAENLPRIFEPTFTTKSVEEGTGLGLSISRRLVRAFGGDLEVESTREGEGTTFLAWFPRSP